MGRFLKLILEARQEARSRHLFKPVSYNTANQLK